MYLPFRIPMSNADMPLLLSLQKGQPCLCGFWILNGYRVSFPWDISPVKMQFLQLSASFEFSLVKKKKKKTSECHNQTKTVIETKSALLSMSSMSICGQPSKAVSLTLPRVQRSPPPSAASLVQPFRQSSLATRSQGSWPPPVTTPSLSHWNITSISVPLQQALLKCLNLAGYFPRESYKSPIPSFLFNSFIQEIFNEHVLLRYWCGTLLSH